MNSPLSHLPLRERKRARTRIALVEALLDRLVERPLDDIQVSELVEAVDISPATFFNYFPSKQDLLTHYIQLWSLQFGALARSVEAEHDSALAAIEALVTSTAQMSSQGPNVMMEIIVHQARNLPGKAPDPVEPAERMMYLPDVADVEDLSDRGLASIITDLLSKAVKRGELPPGTDIGQLALAVGSTFYGVHLIMATRYPDAVADLQRKQLQMLWAGVWALAQQEE